MAPDQLGSTLSIQALALGSSNTTTSDEIPLFFYKIKYFGMGIFGKI